MHDRDWDDFRYFLVVSDRGSISSTAKYLNVNHSTVLRRIAGLEKRLGVRLFDRLARGYAITAAGEELRRDLGQVNGQIEAAERRLSGRDRGLAGTTRITTTDTLARGLLMPYLAAFRARHPAIKFEIVINNTFLSLTKREADVAVRPSNRPPEHLIGRAVGRIRTAIYGAKSYLGKTERTMWSNYDWVAPDETLAHLAQARWMKDNVPVERIAARVDSLMGMFDMVRHGMGVGLLLCLLADGQDDLIRLADPLPELDTELWILTHPDMKQLARIKAVTDFLYENLRTSDKIVSGEGRRIRR